VLSPARQITNHSTGESIQAITSAGTDNENQQHKIKQTKNTKKLHKTIIKLPANTLGNIVLTNSLTYIHWLKV